MCMYVLHVGISHLLVVGQFNADGKHQVPTEQSNGQVEVDKVVHGRKQLFSVDFSTHIRSHEWNTKQNRVASGEN